MKPTMLSSRRAASLIALILISLNAKTNSKYIATNVGGALRRQLQSQHQQQHATTHKGTKFHPSDGMYHAKPRKHHKGRKRFALGVALLLLLLPLCGILQLICRWRERNYMNNWNDEDEEGFGEDQIYDHQELVALKKKKRRERREKIMGIFRKKKGKKKKASNKNSKETGDGGKKKNQNIFRQKMKQETPKIEQKEQQQPLTYGGPNLLEGSIYDPGFSTDQGRATLI